MADQSEDEKRRVAASDLVAPLTRADQIEPNRYAGLKPQAAPEIAELQPAEETPVADASGRQQASPVLESENLGRTGVDRVRREAIYQLGKAENEKLVVEKAADAEAKSREQSAQITKAAARENAQALVQQAHEMRSVRSRFETLDEKPLDLLEQKKLERDVRPGTEQGDSYFQKALGDQRGEDPFETLERAATSAHAAFNRDQKVFEERIASERNADARHSLEQRKDIHAANYLAATSHRIADHIEVLTGSANTEDGLKFRTRAEDYEAQSQKLQDRFRQRTGRTVVTDEQTVTRENEAAVRVRDSSSGNTRADAPPERTGRDEETGEGAVEMTDAKREKQGRSSQGEKGAGERQWARVDQPTRPTGRDSSGR